MSPRGEAEAMSDHRRFFIDPGQIEGDMAVIREETAHQIARVLRLREGEPIRLLDGSGREYDARIASVSAGEVVVDIVGLCACEREPRLALTLAVCMPKADKLDLIVQKATELGVSRLIVASSERVVSRPEPAKAASRIERWRRIAEEAAEQCGRCRTPEVIGIIDFGELSGYIAGHAVSMIAWEDETRASLKSVLSQHARAESAMLIVGPEGGLTQREVAYARSAGALCVSLGSRILRCETAAIAACAAVMYELEGEL